VSGAADNSIGNITGSNSVNVFLGLGLPWMIAAMYWSANAGEVCGPVTGNPCNALQQAWHDKYAGEAWHYEGMPIGFAVPAGDLGYSVAVFTACALICLGTIILRRAVYGYELGGPEGPKMATAVFFVLLWVVYIALSSAAA
jgi:solute carrier family 8 (sodium/calcium exchanger)